MNKKIVIAVITIIAIIVICIVAGIVWANTHYSIVAGKVGVVVNQVGGVVRIQKGPLGWAEKSLWETVKYFDIMVRTEDMISPSQTMENGSITVVDPKPLGKLRYGAVAVNAKDVSNIYMDVTVQWHIDADRDGWQERIAKLFLDYPAQDYDTKTVLPTVRKAIYDFATYYTCDELIFTKREEFSNNLLPYVQNVINNVSSLHGAVVMDLISSRRPIPPVDVQRAYQKVLASIKEAESILIIANATREASIRIAEGQKIAIELVVNATQSSVERLMEQNLTASEAIQYLGLQYTFDSLKRIAELNPTWKITLFINAPTVTYTVPISPEEP